MTQEIPTNPTPAGHSATPSGSSPAHAGPPELGDVVDALDDAASTLKTVVRNQGRTIMDEIDCFVRDRPIASLALAGGLGYLLARLTR